MKIKEKTWQSRRDFNAVFVCEFCGTEKVIRNCYDDEYFHNERIPYFSCEKCSKTSGVATSSPKYPDEVQL